MSDVKVPLLDLKAQYAVIRDEVHAAINEVVESQYFVLGPTVADFEHSIAEYGEVKHAIGCASGSDAILLALLALGIGHGDEVIVPSYSFFATAGYVQRTGAKPVFADIDPVTYNVDPASIRDAAARCTSLKAIMPVHLYGQAADMDAILEIGSTLGVPVIEDAAQAIGTRDSQGARVGTRGAIGCFSFFPSKNLGGYGDGGMVTTQDDGLAEKLKTIRVHGGKPKYYHKVVGVNSRLDALQAAVLKVKLAHLDNWSASRHRNAQYYDRAFAEAGARPTGATHDVSLGVRTPQPADAPATHIYNQYVIRVAPELRDPLRAYLQERHIGTEIYYPVPLHLQECFADLGYGDGDLPQSEAAARETIALPIYPELAERQLQHVADTVIEFSEARAAV